MNYDNSFLKDEFYSMLGRDPSAIDSLQEGSADGFWYLDLENPDREWLDARARCWTMLGYGVEASQSKTF